MLNSLIFHSFMQDQDYCLHVQRRAETFMLIDTFKQGIPPKHVQSSTNDFNSDHPATISVQIMQSLSRKVNKITIELTNSAGSTESHPLKPGK